MAGSSPAPRPAARPRAYTLPVGGVGERTKPPVLKTGRPKASRVRILPPPPGAERPVPLSSRVLSSQSAARLQHEPEGVEPLGSPPCCAGCTTPWERARSCTVAQSVQLPSDSAGVAVCWGLRRTVEFGRRRGSQAVKDNGLLNRRGVHAPPRVQIPPSPPVAGRRDAASSLGVPMDRRGTPRRKPRAEAAGSAVGVEIEPGVSQRTNR